jgi:hypothetical protein
MASVQEAQPLYHVVPRFDIVAKGGALELGTVVDSLLILRPLNRNKVVPIPDDLRYPPAEQGGFTQTRSRLREGHGSIWAQSLVFQGAGASASASAQSETVSTVTCDAIITTYFDPNTAYVAQTLASKDVNDFFIGSGYEDDVYMITGLKVAKTLRYSSTTTTQRAADVEAAAPEPNTGTDLGLNVGGSTNKGNKVEFDIDDIVVGFRVRRYAYVPASRNPFSNKKKLTGDDYLKGAAMHEHAEKEIKGPNATYKQKPVKEEQDAQSEGKTFSENGECWIDPTK